MTLLMDSHVFLWWVADEPRLSPRAREKIANPDNEILFSAVSGWEIAIKAALGRLVVSIRAQRRPDLYGPFTTNTTIRSFAVSTA